MVCPSSPMVGLASKCSACGDEIPGSGEGGLVEIKTELLVEVIVIVREVGPFLDKGGDETETTFVVFGKGHVGRGVVSEDKCVRCCPDVLKAIARKQLSDIASVAGIFVKEVTSLIESDVEKAVVLIKCLTIGVIRVDFGNTDGTTRAKDTTEFFQEFVPIPFTEKAQTKAHVDEVKCMEGEVEYEEDIHFLEV